MEASETNKINKLQRDASLVNRGLFKSPPDLISLNHHQSGVKSRIQRMPELSEGSLRIYDTAPTVVPCKRLSCAERTTPMGFILCSTLLTGLEPRGVPAPRLTVRSLQPSPVKSEPPPRLVPRYTYQLFLSSSRNLKGPSCETPLSIPFASSVNKVANPGGSNWQRPRRIKRK